MNLRMAWTRSAWAIPVRKKRRKEERKIIETATILVFLIFFPLREGFIAG